MAIRHQNRRAELIADGKCPLCAGREDLITGRFYGVKCRAKQLQNKVDQRKRQEAPPTPLDIDPGRSVWDVPVDGLALALAETDAHLSEAV